jgi:hypothetical protein
MGLPHNGFRKRRGKTSHESVTRKLKEGDGTDGCWFIVLSDGPPQGLGAVGGCPQVEEKAGIESIHSRSVEGLPRTCATNASPLNRKIAISFSPLALVDRVQIFGRGLFTLLSRLPDPLACRLPSFPLQLFGEGVPHIRAHVVGSARDLFAHVIGHPYGNAHDVTLIVCQQD